MNIKTVIMAGGKGTRISSIANDIPKPMIDICGKPLLEHQIDCLKKQGIKDITITVGHLGHVIQDYFGDGQALEANLEYIVENEPLGTGGALYYLKDCTEKTILLINGDILFDVNIDKFFQFHRSKNADITLFTHPNNHPYDSAVIETDCEGKITGWLNKEDKRGDYKNVVNAGIHLINTEILSDIFIQNQAVKIDLDRDVLKPRIPKSNMYVYQSPEYVKDMGTPERYHSVCRDFKDGKPGNKNLTVKQKAVFLDRDNTLIFDEGFMTKPDQIRLLAGAAEAVKLINQSGYLAIVVTNQPVIARGDCTFEELQQLHIRLETLLGKEGSYLDDIFFCPHHPDKGFEGERPEYKIECNCRKPKPGMLRMAADKYNIDLSQSFMVGDSTNDILAGQAAGCKTAFIGDLQKGTMLGADIIESNVLKTLEKVFKYEK